MKLLENTSRFRRTPKGLLTNMYDHLKRRHEISFTLKEFHERYLSDRKFKRLYSEWVKSSFKKQYKPSLDRISNKLGYSVKNTQMLNWAENRYKQTMERRCRKGVVLQLMGDKIVKRYKSQREAVLTTGISQGNMSMVLNGKRQTAGGYKFIYENPELLTNPNLNK